MLRSLVPYLIGASALLLLFGVYEGRNDASGLLIRSLAVLHVGGGALAAYLTRTWRGQASLRNTQGFWHWLTSMAIVLAAGGYPSPLWLLFLVGAIVSGVMCDRTGMFINFFVAGIALAGPHLGSGVDPSAATAIAMQMLMLLFVSVVAETSSTRLLAERGKHERAEERLRLSNRRLTASITRMKQHDEESRLLTEMGRMLQTANSVPEMDEIIGTYLHELFPSESGALFVYSPSRNDLEARVTWGDFPDKRSERVISPDQCRALRRGSLYVQSTEGATLPCPHVESGSWNDVICIPLMAHGDVLGVFHLRMPVTDADRLVHDSPRKASGALSLAVSVAEYIALAVANQRLRETLQNQAVRDSLTGLFNRRYAEETLRREIERAARHKAPLSILFADIDHFKVVNDTYGHDAGDLVLQRLGTLIETRTRGHDVACRYGGEEFLIILSDASRETARQRAESLRHDIKMLGVVHDHRAISVTVSFGIASFPEHGNAAAGLLRKADAALYQAKNSGRNCVVVADEGTVEAETSDKGTAGSRRPTESADA